jgi:hypothetical protein
MVWLLAASAKQVYNSCLVGNPAPSVARRLELLQHPRPGDLVLEISALGVRGREPVVGRLIGTAKLSLESPDWDVDADGPLPLIDYWFIETVFGELQTWENCKFIRVFEDWIDDRIEEDADKIPLRLSSSTMDRMAWAREAIVRHGLSDVLKQSAV